MSLTVRILQTGSSVARTYFVQWMAEPGTIEAWNTSFLIEGGDRPILVDTGYRPEAAAKMGLNIRKPPELDLVRQLGDLDIAPEDVGHVILTHLHIDHTGGVSHFPNARIVVQQKELQRAVAPVHPEGLPMLGGSCAYDRDDVATIMSTPRDRLLVLNGSAEIAPGVRCVLLGGHTVGSQGVYVETDEGIVVLPGDVCACYANFEKGPWPTGFYYNWDDLVFAQRRVIAEADIIVPSHDPELGNRYPDRVVRGKGVRANRPL